MPKYTVKIPGLSLNMHKYAFKDKQSSFISSDAILSLLSCENIAFIRSVKLAKKSDINISF